MEGQRQTKEETREVINQSENKKKTKVSSRDMKPTSVQAQVFATEL